MKSTDCAHKLELSKLTLYFNITHCFNFYNVFYSLNNKKLSYFTLKNQTFITKKNNSTILALTNKKCLQG